MGGGLQVAVSPVPLGELLRSEVAPLVGNANLENCPTMLVRFRRKDEAVPVLLRWLDDNAG